MDKEKLLAWIEMRINEHKSQVDILYKLNDDRYPQYFIDNERTEYDYHSGARSELVFLRQCVTEFKAFDIVPTEST